MHFYDLFINVLIICSILLFSVPQSFNQNVGPLVKMTNGQVWPKPVFQHNFDEYLTVEPENFHFNVRLNILTTKTHILNFLTNI